MVILQPLFWEKESAAINTGLDFGCIGAGGLRPMELACGLTAGLNGYFVKMVRVLQEHPGQRAPSV